MLIASDSSRRRIYFLNSIFKSNLGFLIYLFVYFEVFIVPIAIVNETETQKNLNDSLEISNSDVHLDYFFLKDYNFKKNKAVAQPKQIVLPSLKAFLVKLSHTKITSGTKSQRRINF